MGLETRGAHESHHAKTLKTTRRVSRRAFLVPGKRRFGAFPVGPAFFTGGPPKSDSGVNLAGPQVVSVTRNGQGTLLKLDNVGTFSPTNPIEIRGTAAVNGQTTQGFGAFGAGGFNSPSLLGVAYSVPYFHDGSAHTLEDVAARHRLGDAPATIASTLSAQELSDLLAFVRSIDDDTATLPNATDLFIAP